MTKELLEKFLSNGCTPKEVEEVMRWAQKDALSGAGRELAYNDWNSFGAISPDKEVLTNKKFSTLLDKIHHRININRNTVKDRPAKAISLMMTRLTRAAAMLLIPVLLVLFYVLSKGSFNGNNATGSVVDSLEIIAPIGSRTIFRLADGTRVHLNYGSRIKYPRIFKGATRTLSLSGEGYFEVAHNPEKPFIVKTKGLNIIATGTTFNVMAYPDSHNIATTLVEGKVIVEKSDGHGKAGTIGSMLPGQHFDYNTLTGASLSTRGHIQKYIAWKDGLLVFDNAGIGEVAVRLGRMFHATIEVSADIKDYTYTVTLEDEPLSQILYLMTQTTPVSYKIFPRKKLPDGTYSKQKIILEKK